MLKPRGAHPPAGRPQRGFTLTELLVTVAVVAVGSMMAAPAVSDLVANRSVHSAAQDILEGINTARAEAVRRNRPVKFQLRADGRGWSLVDPATATTLLAHNSPEWSRLAIASQGSLTGVTFLPNGLRAPGSQLSQVTVSSAAGAAASRRIDVFGGGMVRMCDPAITAAGQPRKC